ncbi:MAG TPA: 2-amino-4-hydroxy-6-hydroxymethyldihydropteridine diphosphokinase [Chthoniobacterales bacterium]|jgi:2-amino-4-hydroxy-6-hydroxymethyldihydropteridine diphosphokinase|nr:2-amino-4-hydroxy-6-hydroxymethyldihydropteridine diphosphokinase [Chthoniobacterales bacterium]
MRVGIALGSNLGDRLANLSAARKGIVDLVGGKALRMSPVYETEAIGCEPGAGKFLNAVLEIEYDGDSTELLEELIRVEESLGRDRDHARNVSRKIDIDFLYADELNVQNERLQLPHPRMHLRRFVLQPLADIRPELVLPNQTKSVRELLAQIQDSTKVIHFAEKW